MGGCKYIIGNREYSYQELINEIIKQNSSEFLEADDILFSRSSGEVLQREITEKLNSLKVTAKTEPNTSYNDGEPIISATNAISTQQLIDHPEFKIRTGARIAQMNKDNFIINQTEIYKQQGMSEEVARNAALNEINHWDQIQKDAMTMHSLVNEFDYRKSSFDFEQLAKGTVFESVASDLYASLNGVLKRSVYGSVKSNSVPSTTINNLNLRTQLEGLDEDLLVHIDKLIVDGDGNIHVYSFKTTTTSPNDWKDAKEQKYRIQLAIIKRTLESLGFNPKNISLNIIPIRINYDENLENITSAIVLDPISYNLFHKQTGGIGNKLAKEENWVKKIIKSTTNFDGINASDRDPVDQQLKYLFLNQDLKVEGLRFTAESWISRNMKEGGKIKRVQDPDYDFIIYFSEDDIVKIPKGGSTDPLKNSEVLKEVNNRTGLLDKNDGDVMNHIINDVKRSHDQGVSNFIQYGYSSAFLNKILFPYCRKHIVKDDKFENDWEFIENDVLNAANILVFRNRDTHQLDFVLMSPYNLKTKAKLKKSNEHILGDHLYSAQNVGSLINYKPTFGNLEAVRAALIINQVLPKLTGEFNLGKLHIVSLEQGGQGNLYELETLSKDMVTPLVKFMNENPNLEVNNNFIGQHYINPLTILLQEYQNIMDNSTDRERSRLNDLDFEEFFKEENDSVEAKRTLLLELAQKIPQLKGFESLSNKENLSQNEGDAISFSNMKKLYRLTLQALQYYETNEVSSIEQKMNSMTREMLVTNKIPNRNFQSIVQVYTAAIDNIASKTLKDVQKMRPYFQEYYDKCGYSRLQNDLIGGQARAFDRLYALDEQGNRTLTLKNPYNPAEDLTDYERTFLKKLLLDFNKIRARMYGNKDFNFTDVNSDALKAYIDSHGDYFDIPLERAGKATRRQKVSSKDRLIKGWGLIRDIYQEGGKDAFEKLVMKLTDEEKEDMLSGIESWQLRNPFKNGEGDRRIGYIGNHEIDFFETNLESLIIDFYERQYQYEELNKALVVTKAVQFQLSILQDLTNDKDTIEQTQKLINDFAKVNIFGASLMEEHSKKIMTFVSPLKNVVSKTLIAGNIVSAFRDVFEGVWQNSMRTINHFQTDISMKDLMSGYKHVVENSFTDKRSINIVNQLCLKYRLSNIDIAHISEGMKTEGGVVNYDDWLYATIRKPDFLNRMVLFVAQCHKDGIWDAFSINDSGELIYDWKKDKRFSIYASGDKNNPEYAKQMGAYYNAVRAYNNDHPDSPISFNSEETPLPEPYSQKEIEIFKNLANSIYGAYDKSVKAMYEHTALASVFGMFTTWMNGMYANYFMKPGQYSNTDFEIDQAQNEKGNLLFFDDLGNQIYKSGDKYYYDGTDIEVTENLNNIQPIMDKIPVVVQGVFYSLKDATKALVNGEIKQFLADSPQDRKNLMKLLTDLLASMLISLLVKKALTSSYKTYKKEDMIDNPFIVNATVELLYKSTSRSFDGFKGPLNIIEWMGEDVTPPIYTQNIKLIKDFGKFVFGSKTFSDVMTGSVGAFRVAQDSYKAEKRKEI